MKHSLSTINTHTGSFSPDVLDILRPELTVMLRTQEFGNALFSLTNIRANDPDGDGTLSFRYGVAKDEENNLQFLLDFDQYTESQVELSVDTLIERCDKYHDLIYDAFRWCIETGKIEIFDPKSKHI